MSAILESGKAQFKDRMSGKLMSVEVPKWPVNGKPSVIYFKPSMNFRDQGEVLKLHSQNKQAEAVVLTFILRAMDENGNKLCKRANMTELMMEHDPDIISHIVTEMNGDDPGMEDATKN